MSVIAMAAINDCGFDLIQHPPYSPDLTPSDFCLFPKSIKAISGTHLQADDDVIHAVEAGQSKKGLILLNVALRPSNIAGKIV